MKTTSAFFLLVLCASSTLGQTLEWNRQLGTSSREWSWDVSADGMGGVYISGVTSGSLEGTNAGGNDAFISKYDEGGTLQWTRQLGTSSEDESRGVSADGLGNVYMAGYTGGNLEGPNVGGNDAFISKYDDSGTLEWIRQLGTSSDDGSQGVSADGLGSIYISGWTLGSLGGPNAGSTDAFISKYDASGALQWTRQLGTNSSEFTYGVSADRLGSVYISGYTEGSLEGMNAGREDAFLSKYDDSGALQWTRQLGTSSWDWSNGVSADGLGSVYIAGFTDGKLGETDGRGRDAFISKYDSSGTLQWTQQLSISDLDLGNGVSADGLGNVYISGQTRVSGDQGFNLEAFVSKYDSSGTLQWTRQLGTSSDDISWAVSADRLGNVYISGGYEGSLSGGSDEFDAFVAKFTSAPAFDFDRDGDVDGDDVDALVGEIIAGTNDSAFDLSADGAVNNADLGQWLGDAATNNGFSAPYLLGDANLDGVVNASDLNALGQNWLSHSNAWQLGDFTADGNVDANDLEELAQNWQASIPSAAAPESIPEPSGMAILCVGAVLSALMRFRAYPRSS